MINSSSNSCFPPLQMYPVADDHVVSSSLDGSSAGTAGETDQTSTSLLYNLSMLKNRVHQVQSLVTILISPDQQARQPESVSMAISSMGPLVQELIMAASSILLTCQQISSSASTPAAPGNNNSELPHAQHVRLPNHDSSSLSNSQHFGEVGNIAQEIRSSQSRLFSTDQTIGWYGENCNTGRSAIQISHNKAQKRDQFPSGNGGVSSVKNYDIIEVDAADLLAKYTHYCQVCGKGFKRDANLRMHMRAHGDEYKTSAALTNPMKNSGGGAGLDKLESSMKLPKKYSCPQEGCRWNQKHAKFQPLKSMICVKNHYKRSHCPKMYVCKRCNRKQFSVLSDLRTHEKHCGDLKWQCSCGTTFSRKDKLIGHVNLFVGHTPVVNINAAATKTARRLEHRTTLVV